MKDLLPVDIPGIEARQPIVIAGPCSAESEEQIMNTASQLSSYGIKIFRAGIWKPRTKPGGFEGIGAQGLQWLANVKKKFGMMIATEVATRQHVMDAVAGGIDIMWLGARTSANPFAVQEIADAIKELGATDKIILVKNPVNPDLELWVGALLRIYNAGCHRLGAIHRGFSTYGKHLYRNEPQWHIPTELRLRYPKLPVFCDPSHMGGKRELIGPISQQAIDMGFSGLIVESHCNPDCALSDAAQQILPEILNYILNTLVVRDEKQSTENLSLLRQQIDRIDNQLLEVLSERLRVCREIGRYKKEHHMQVVQPNRYNDIMADRIALATEMGLGANFMRTMLLAIHDESVRQQIEILNDRLR